MTQHCVWYVKDTNLKANHNEAAKELYDFILCLICQRYKFKSKSQPTVALCIFFVILCLICQRYKFKSKSQLNEYPCRPATYCVWYVKDTNLKANHNLEWDKTIVDKLCLICQRYKFKSKLQYVVTSKKVKGTADRNASEFRQPTSAKRSPFLSRFDAKLRKDFESAIELVERNVKMSDWWVVEYTSQPPNLRVYNGCVMGA